MQPVGGDNYLVHIHVCIILAHMPITKAKREIASITIRLYPRTHKVLKALSLRTGQSIARMVDDSIVLFAHEKND